MSRKPRLSLTKTQIQAGVGAELLALCQAVTEDGSLSKEEIVELRLWLNANRSADLPAVAFLVETVERIVADGKVTHDEVQELYRAIEKVLPPDARRHAVTARREVEAEECARERAGREEQKRQAREERDRNRPVASANFMVAGVHYEGRADVIEEFVDAGDTVFLARDYKNRFSRNAVEIRLSNGMQIGFVPEVDAVDLAPLIDRGCSHLAYITKVLAGGRVPIPVVQAYLHSPDATVEGTVLQSAVPAKVVPPGSRMRWKRERNNARQAAGRGGCLSALLLGGLTASVWLALQIIL